MAKQVETFAKSNKHFGNLIDKILISSSNSLTKKRKSNNNRIKEAINLKYNNS